MPALTVHVPYRVPYADTDQMGVVYYGNYLTYFERARNELLRAVGLPYREIEARGFALPVLAAHVDYRSAARYDDELEIRGWLGWMKSIRIRVDCTVHGGGGLLAEGYTEHAFVNRASLKPSRIPPDIAEAFRAALGSQEH